MADTRFARKPGVVWRLAPDRVLVRHVWPPEGEVDGHDEAADLLGLAALVWIALDEPGSADDICTRLDEGDTPAPPDEVAQAIADLIATGWVSRS